MDGNTYAATVELTEANFEQEVIQSDEPVIVDFWAAWCGPCRTIAPIVDGLSEKYIGRLKVGKLNVDENGEVAARFNVRSIPTLLLFQGGNVQEVIVGVQPEGQLHEIVERHI